MKKTAAYIFIFVYALMLCKPFAPLIEDSLAHIFWYSQHLATVHYENGKLHVHKEMMDNAKKDEPVKERNSSKKDNQTVDHYYLHLFDKQKANSPSLQCMYLYTSNLSYNFPEADFPPPKA